MNKLIPGGACSYNKMHMMYPKGYPEAIKYARGAYLYDEDNKRYLDFICADGAISIGYNFPVISMAVREAISEGTLYSLPSKKIYELANILKEEIGFERYMFAITEVDVVGMAKRLARAVSNRDKIIYLDDSILSNSINGIPKVIFFNQIHINRWDYKALTKVLGKGNIAAVYVNPPNRCPLDDKFIESLKFYKKICKDLGVALIFNELGTGFRVSMGGMTEISGVRPDLAIYGGAMGNGHCIATLAGNLKYMDRLSQDVLVYNQYGGETVGVSAAIETIKFMKIVGAIDHMKKLSKEFVIGIADNDIFELAGDHPRLFFDFHDEPDGMNKWIFFQQCIQEGIMFTDKILFNYSMSLDNIKTACTIVNKVVRRMENGEFSLVGRKPYVC